jgi:predicted  nucleic acid-binding Zn-ribbon protein
MLEIYERCIRYYAYESITETEEAAKKTKADLNSVNKKMDKVRELLVNDQISPEDYAAIRKKLEEKIYSLESKLSQSDKKEENLNNLIKELANTLIDISGSYNEANIELKREIIAAIYPDKIVFDKGNSIIPSISEGAELIYLIDKKIPKIENETNSGKKN